ncbi:class F sortase [Rhodococcus sp. BH5]|uniref:class F sortase n=1 Tax=Rhodococcus sp. BH5 TaxID=2871702 RepID=UPI0022CD8616|nr:class F sortase [Rhodococcus sp. BH5]MCZ9635050.1 class F sortase [Rhodococcus sp. BH5]
MNGIEPGPESDYPLDDVDLPDADGEFDDAQTEFIVTAGSPLVRFGEPSEPFPVGGSGSMPSPAPGAAAWSTATVASPVPQSWWHRLSGVGRALLVTTPLLVVAAAVAIIAALTYASGEGGPPPAFVDSATGVQDSLPEPVFAAVPPEFGAGMTMRIGDADGPVDPVNLVGGTTLLPPSDISRLGWYAASPLPGVDGAGSTVITGHVNDAVQGEGYAARFVRLSVGDTVTVSVDGEPHVYRVSQAPTMTPKGGQLPDVVNDTVGENRLVLITCGGEYVGGATGYADNIIVVAEPVAGDR